MTVITSTVIWVQKVWGCDQFVLHEFELKIEKYDAGNLTLSRCRIVITHFD